MKFEKEYKKAAELITPDREQLDRMKANVLKNIEKPSKPVIWQKIAYAGGSVAACAAITLLAVSILPQLRSRESMTDTNASTINLFADKSMEDAVTAGEAAAEDDAMVAQTSSDAICEDAADTASTTAVDNGKIYTEYYQETAENDDAYEETPDESYVIEPVPDRGGIEGGEEVVEIPVSQEPADSGTGSYDNAPNPAEESPSAEIPAEAAEEDVPDEAEEEDEAVPAEVPADAADYDGGNDSGDDVIVEDDVEEDIAEEEYDESAPVEGGYPDETLDYCEATCDADWDAETTETDPGAENPGFYPSYDPMYDATREYDPLSPWSIIMIKADRSEVFFSYKWYLGNKGVYFIINRSKADIISADSMPPVFNSGELTDTVTGEVYRYEFVSEDASMVWLYDDTGLLGEYIIE